MEVESLVIEGVFNYYIFKGVKLIDKWVWLRSFCSGYWLLVG